MVCRNCAAEISVDAVRCPACGTVVSYGRVPVEPSLATDTSSKPAIRAVISAALCALCLLFLLGLSYLNTKWWSQGAFNAQALGYFIGGLLFPLVVGGIVLVLIRKGRRTKMHVSQQLLIAVVSAFATGLLSLGGTAASQLREPVDVDQQIAHLLQQALGKEPIPAHGNWYDEPTRAFYRDMFAYGNEYRTSLQNVDRSAIGHLYTPQSYASRASMQASIKELHELLTVDQKYDSLDPLLEKMESRIMAADASRRQKEDFLNGFRNSAGISLQGRQETFRAEEQWLESAIELYEWTYSHSSDYHVKGQKLMFAKDALLVEFEEKQSKSLNLRKAAVDASEAFEAERKNAIAKIRVKTSDLLNGDRPGKE